MTKQIEQLQKHVIEGKLLMQKWAKEATSKEEPLKFGDVLVTVKSKNLMSSQNV